MKIPFTFRRISFTILCLIYFIQSSAYAQNCPTLPGGYKIGDFNGVSHINLYPGLVPADAPVGAEGASTIGYVFFDNASVDVSSKKSITIHPTLDGATIGKVLFNLWQLSFNAGTSLKIYKGIDETGSLVDDINHGNFASKLSNEYVVEGPATLVFYGSTPNVANSNIIRFTTGDISLPTCNGNRTGLVWKDFITPNSYIVIDDQEDAVNNLSTAYEYTPNCIAFFDANKNFVRMESSFCLDQEKQSPSTGYWFYPGEYRFTLNSTSNYDIDRNGFDASVDNLKIARILWLIEQSASASNNEKKNIQLAIWSTQQNTVSNTFTAGSWEDQAQSAVPTIPAVPEPTFSMNFPTGETGLDVVNSGTIQVDIPFSWSTVEAGQTNVVRLDIPTGVTVVSVVGGTILGQDLTITASTATLTLSSSVIGKFLIKAIYDNPDYYNIHNLQVFTPCNTSDPSLASQEFLHIGEENLERPFRSISVEWTTSLPVRLVKFGAFLENDIAQLEWNTTEEVNFSHFEIEKSTDAKKWNLVSKVASNPFGNYKYEDTNIAGMSTVYYRLKMVDIDSKYAYSAIRSLVRKNIEPVATLYPNPVGNILNISDLDIRNVSSFKVYDQWGVLKMQTMEIMENKFDLTALKNGIYIINFTMKNGKSLSQKIVVRK